MKHPEIKEVALVEPLYEKAFTMLRDGMRSYAEGDTDLAIALYDRDKALDKAQSEVIRELTKHMDNNTGRIKSFLHLIFIVRSLERVGDHAVNIAEDGIFLEAAADVRHLGPELAAQEIDAQA